MSKELVLWNAGVGNTCYITLRRASDRFYYRSGGTYETQTPANWATYAFSIALADAVTGDYEADFPTLNTPPGLYEVSFWKRVGGTAAVTDTRLGYDTVVWDGDELVTLEMVHGMVGRNQGFRNTVYSGNLLVSFDICRYDTAANASLNDGVTGLRRKYSISCTYDGSGNQLTNSMRKI